MNLSREVIKDLLPLYATGEASQETCELVEEFLQKDAELRGLLGKMTEAEAMLEQKPKAPDLEDAQLRSLRKTRVMLRYRGLVMGIAIAYSLLPLAFVYSDGKFKWLVMENASREVWVGCVVVAAALWIVYWMIARKTRHSGI
jgi:hypothetical protein